MCRHGQPRRAGEPYPAAAEHQRPDRQVSQPAAGGCASSAGACRADGDPDADARTRAGLESAGERAGRRRSRGRRKRRRGTTKKRALPPAPLTTTHGKSRLRKSCFVHTRDALGTLPEATSNAAFRAVAVVELARGLPVSRPAVRSTGVLKSGPAATAVGKRRLRGQRRASPVCRGSRTSGRMRSTFQRAAEAKGAQKREVAMIAPVASRSQSMLAGRALKVFTGEVASCDGADSLHQHDRQGGVLGPRGGEMYELSETGEREHWARVTAGSPEAASPRVARQPGATVAGDRGAFTPTATARRRPRATRWRRPRARRDARQLRDRLGHRPGAIRHGSP